MTGLSKLWRRHLSNPLATTALRNLPLHALQRPPRQPPAPALQPNPHIRRNLPHLCTQHPIQRIRAQQLAAQRLQVWRLQQLHVELRIFHKQMHHVRQLCFTGIPITCPLDLLVPRVPLIRIMRPIHLPPRHRRTAQHGLFRRTQPHKMRPRLVL